MKILLVLFVHKIFKENQEIAFFVSILLKINFSLYIFTICQIHFGYKLYQTSSREFKTFNTRVFLEELWGIWYCHQTLSWVFELLYILKQKLLRWKQGFFQLISKCFTVTNFLGLCFLNNPVLCSQFFQYANLHYHFLIFDFIFTIIFLALQHLYQKQ